MAHQPERLRRSGLAQPAFVTLFALAAYSDPGAPPRPVWHDEFAGPAGASFDPTKWVADTGGHGFGNQERQFYTTRAENVALDGAGHLVITARAEPPSSADECWYGSCRYTSTRLKTKGLFAQAYGRFEARIRVPRGQGLWPAFWMLGADIDSVGWPRCGEIDIMENIGREPAIAHGTLHGPGYSGADGIGRADTLSHGAYADDFHVFAVSWRPDEIRWFVDGREYHRMTPADLPRGTRWVFDHPFFLLLNVAVGGGWPGDPDASTTFPQQMVVDYVRVYRDP
ncbi:MAG TPA: glycoside hydrolase family 16 protein [Gemmatimonadales bacterium]